MRPIHLALLLTLASACTSPSVAGDVQGEPVCPDFELGAARTKMKGSLEKPVKISVVEDDEVRWERVLLGKRTPADADPKFVVEDDDETYTIRWAQCPNAFAPKRVDMQMRAEDITSSYACGEAVTYHEQPLEVRQGDPSSRVVSWVAPPEPECWTSSVPEADGEDDAGAPDAGSDEVTPDAGSTETAADAGSEDAAASTDAGGEPAPKPTGEPKTPPATKPPATKPPATKPEPPAPPVTKPQPPANP